MRRIALAAAVVATLVACARRPDPELARAVRDYDDALVRAFATSDAAGLARVAGKKEADRVRILVDLKRSAKLALESTIEDFEVTRVETRGDTATVETRERWRYHDRGLAPGAPSGPELVSQMTMRYALIREGGRWKVESAATLSNAYLTPAAAGGAAHAAPKP
jgi:hypothetical protein